MSIWKIENISKQQVKLTISLGGNNNPGFILKPGEIILSKDRLTAPLDAQERRGIIEIDKDFNNSELNLPLGKIMKSIEGAIKDVDDYFKK